MNRRKTKIYKLHLGKTPSDRCDILEMDTDKFKTCNDELIKTIVERFIHEVVQTEADVVVNNGDVSIKFRCEDFEWCIAPRKDNLKITCLVVFKVVDDIEFKLEAEF